MKVKTILLMAIVISVLLSGAAYAQDETKEKKEKNFGVDVSYVINPDEDVKDWGVSSHYLKENFMFELGLTPATGIGNQLYLDISYLWRQMNDEGEYAGFLGGLGVESLFTGGSEFGGVVQLGFEDKSGLMFRVKGAILPWIAALYFEVGQSF